MFSITLFEYVGKVLFTFIFLNPEGGIISTTKNRLEKEDLHSKRIEHEQLLSTKP